MCIRDRVYSGGTRFGKNMSELHNCDEKQCRQCRQFYVGAHVWKLTEPMTQRDWGKLSFLSFGYLSKEITADQYEQVPVQACFINEESEPGHFKVRLYHGPKEELNIKGTKNSFVRKFWPSSLERSLNNNGKSAQYGKFERAIDLSPFSQKNVVGAILDLLLEKKI